MMLMAVRFTRPKITFLSTRSVLWP